MKNTVSTTGGLDFAGLLGFEDLDLAGGTMRDAVADAFNKIGEVRGNTNPVEPQLDTRKLLGFEHLDESLPDSGSAVADAFNKIGEVR